MPVLASVLLHPGDCEVLLSTPLVLTIPTSIFHSQSVLLWCPSSCESFSEWFTIFLIYLSLAQFLGLTITIWRLGQLFHNCGFLVTFCLLGKQISVVALSNSNFSLIPFFYSVTKSFSWLWLALCPVFIVFEIIELLGMIIAQTAWLVKQKPGKRKKYSVIEHALTVRSVRFKIKWMLHSKGSCWIFIFCAKWNLDNIFQYVQVDEKMLLFQENYCKESVLINVLWAIQCEK